MHVLKGLARKREREKERGEGGKCPFRDHQLPRKKSERVKFHREREKESPGGTARTHTSKVQLL